MPGIMLVLMPGVAGWLLITLPLWALGVIHPLGRLVMEDRVPEERDVR